LLIENQWNRIQLNTKNGTILQWFDKVLNQNLIDSNGLYQLGEFVGEALAERGSLEFKKMGQFERYGLESVKYIGMISGQIFDTYKFTAKTINGIKTLNSNFMFELRVYHAENQLELAYTIFKNENVNPESFYIAMPFNIPNGHIYCELPGGVMEAGVDQIKGSSNDWNTAQTFVSVASEKAQITITSNEFPLWQFGNINTGRFVAGAKPESTHIFSWPMNNYWVTNFNADFRGEMNWSYFLKTFTSKSHQLSTQFGWNQKIPFTFRVLPKDIHTTFPKQQSIQFLNFNTDHVLVIAIYPQQNTKSILLQIREIAGMQTPLNITSQVTQILKIEEVNAIGETIIGNPKFLNPLESKFLRITYK